MTGKLIRKDLLWPAAPSIRPARGLGATRDSVQQNGPTFTQDRATR